MPVFLPRRWNRQPTQLTDVNVSTGLTQRLVFLFNGAFPNIDHTKTYRAVSGRVNTFDLQGVFSTGAGGVSLLQSDVSRTVLVIGRNLAAAPAATTPLINAGTFGAGGWTIQILTNNSTLRWTDINRADLTFGATTYSAVSQTRQYCVVRDRGSANNARLYNQNGVLQATVAGSTYATITKTIAIENAGAALVAVWQRALSDLEITEVSRNPWQLFRPANSPVFFSLPSVAPVQTLTPNRYDNTQAFYSPTVTAGAVTLTPDRYDNAQSFYSPTVTTTVDLLPGRYDNISTFYTPTVTAGAVTLLPGRYDNASTFYSPTVTSGAFVLLPDRYDNAQTFYSPTVTVGTVTLTPARYDNAQTFYTPTVSLASQTLLPDRFDNVNTFYSPSLAVVTLYKLKYWDGSAWQILKKNPLF